jgi:hypothetical protein
MASRQHLLHLLQHAPGAFFEAESTGEKSYLRGFKRNGDFLLNRKENQPTVGLAWFPAITQGQSDDLDKLGYLIGIRVDNNGAGEPVAKAVVDAAKAWVLALLPGQSLAIKTARSERFDPIHFTYVNAPADVDLKSNVDSAGLACAMALLSFELNRTPRQHIVASGAIPTAIGEIPFFIDKITLGEKKWELIHREAPGLENTRVLDGECGDAIGWFIGKWLGEDWLGLLQDNNDLAPEAQLEIAWEYFGKGSFPEASGIARNIGPSLKQPFDRARSDWIIGAWEMHCGRTESATRHLRRAEHCLREIEDFDWYLQELRGGFLGIALLDAGEVAKANELVSEVYEILTQPGIRPTQRWKRTLMQVAGTYRRILHFLGETKKGLEVHERHCLNLADRTELARCHQDRADDFLAIGEHNAALKSLELAQNSIRYIQVERIRTSTLDFLSSKRMRAKILNLPDTPVAANWSNVPEILKTLEYFKESANLGELQQWFRTHVSNDAIYVHALVYHRGLAYRIGDLITEDWVPDYIQTFRNLHVGKHPAAVAALDSLLQGDGAPWLKIAPY